MTDIFYINIIHLYECFFVKMGILIRICVILIVFEKFTESKFKPHLEEGCVIPSDSQFNRATYRPYHWQTTSKKTYNAGERLKVGTYIWVVCNKDPPGDAVSNTSLHVCTKKKSNTTYWNQTLPDCQEYKGCGRCKEGFNKRGTTSNVTCVDGEWTSADIICATTTTAKTTTNLTKTTTPLITTSPIKNNTSTTNGTPRPTTATTATATTTHQATSEKKENTEITTQKTLCTPECQNGGTCVSTDVCNCPDRFSGKQCENALCNSECQNGGKCVSPDRCQCPEGYNGLRCENVGCKIPANVQQGMTLYDQIERRTITAANRSVIQHGQSLTFTCEPSDVFYFEPNRRLFECVNGSWVAKKRSHVDTWDLGNNGSFPECRKVVCHDDYCKFGGQCKRDHECKCPEQTSGNQCQTPLCSPECQNGTCVSPGECHCLDGFDGLHCENALCNPECQNGGTCVSPYRCLCPDGFHGPSCENETKNCTLEAGQNVNYWHMSTNTTLSEGGKVVHGTRIRVKCQNTGFDYSDYYNSDESSANMECFNGEFTDHGLNCESETKSTPDSSPSTKNCTTIENGKITDRGKSFTCNADYQPSFKNGMDAILYARYSCTCNKRTGNVQCMGTEVECKPIGCKIPANVQQGMTLFDPKERRTISAANRYEIQHGQFLTFTCEPSDVFYFEPHRRIFECVKGLWVSKTRPRVDTWDFGNNGSFPECRKVVCPADYCKFGGHCIRDHECQCPEQTSGKQCETPLCNPGCQNGGTCVLPDTCRCLDGFDGLHCENDIDECSRSDLNDCHEYSNCTNIPGSFTCKCNKGYVDHGGNSGRKCAETCDASDIWTERSTCDAAYCLDENKNRVCTQGNWTVTNLCLKGKRMCSTNESLVNGNSNVSVSSQYYDPNFPNESEMFGADQGRLNSQEKGAYATPSFRAGIWAAGVDDRNPFIQVNFTVPKTITGIVTRGRPKSKYQDDPQWVTQYRFLYSTDCKTFETYNETNGVIKIFSANVNGDQTVPKILPCPVVALCARVNPTKCHGYCSMQFDIMGCNSS